MVCVFIDPYVNWEAYRHNETWWSEEFAIFSPSFQADCVVNRNTGMPSYGQNVWRRGRRRNTEGKKWRAGLQRMNICVVHLALCTPGLSGFSVDCWILKPAHILPETVVSAALRFSSKGYNTGSQLFQTSHKYFLYCSDMAVKI